LEGEIMKGNADLRRAKAETEKVEAALVFEREKLRRSQEAFEKLRQKSAKEFESQEARVRNLGRGVEARESEAEVTASRAQKALSQIQARQEKLEALEARIADERKAIEARLARQREESEARETALRERGEAIEAEAQRARALREEVKTQAAALKDREKRGRELEAELERKRAELERVREGLKKL